MRRRPRTRFPPQQTNPELPVVGEAIWVSGGQLPVTFRLAVHAVRRVERATVLDWSVTPVEASGFEFGDDLPGIDLGLSRASRSDVNVILLDPGTGQVYQPLTHRSRQLFNHCLCTPPWVIQQDLRIGQTRLLQIAYPELPPDVEYIDVGLATVPPFAPCSGDSARVRPHGQVGTPISPGPPERRPQAPERSRCVTPTSRPAGQSLRSTGRRGARPNLGQWTLSSVVGPGRLPAPAVRAAGLQPASGRCLRAEQQSGERPGADQPEHAPRRASGGRPSGFGHGRSIGQPGVRVPVPADLGLWGRSSALR